MTVIFQRSSTCLASHFFSVDFLLAALIFLALFLLAPEVQAAPSLSATSNSEATVTEEGLPSANPIFFKVDRDSVFPADDGDCDAEGRSAFEAIAAQVEASRTSIDAIVYLIQANNWGVRFRSWEPVARLTKKLCETHKLDPRVRQFACGIYANAERHRGRLGRSEDAIKAMGTVMDFLVAGPFDNEGKNGCSVPLSPESNLDLTQEMQGKNGPVQWRPLPEGLSQNGRVDLAKLFTPHSEVIGLAHTELEATQDMDVVFSLSSQGAIQVFLDGAKLLDDPNYHAQGFEQNRLSVRIPKGKHQLLLKVCGADDELGFALRMTDPKGRVLSGIKVSVPGSNLLSPELPQNVLSEGAQRLGKTLKVSATKLQTVADILRTRMEKAPKSLKAALDYAQVAAAFADGDKSERRAISASAKAVTLDPENTFALQLASELTDKWTDEMAYLTKIDELEPGNVRGAMRLAKLVSINGQTRRSLEILESALRLHPGNATLKLAHARVLAQDFDLQGISDATVENLVESCPGNVFVLEEAAKVALENLDPARAAALLRTALSLDYSDTVNRWELAEILLALGDVDGATGEMRQALELSVLDARGWLKLAKTLGGNDREEEALQAIERARAIDPNDAAVHEGAGKILSSMGLNDEALACFQRSLELKPQNPSLREAIEGLQKVRSTVDDLGTDVKELMKAHPPREGEDAVILEQLESVHVYESGLSKRYIRLVARVQTQRGVQKFQSQWMTQNDRQDVKLIAAKIHKPDGRVLESYKKSAVSFSDASTRIYYDVRAQEVRFNALEPHDVLEIAWRVEDIARDNLLSDYFGDIQLVRSDVPKERFVYTLRMPKGRKLYTSIPKSIPITERLIQGPGRDLTYAFSASSVPKLIGEPLMPGSEELAGIIHVSTYETWEEVGRYYAGLIRDQLTVTDSITQALDEILQPLSDKQDRRAIVKAVYGFVVNRTRYVGLEFGIHSFKPYPVHQVLSRRFGDCKDKASLMHALLKAAGIKSNLVLLRTTRHGAISDYPASLSAFDHAILYVPEFDLFLDGTASLHGPEELPHQDSGAQALIVEDKGQSRFITIPSFPSTKTVNRNEFDVTLSSDGAASIQGTSTQSGQLAPAIRSAFQASATREKNFERAWSPLFPGLELKALSFSDLTDIFAPTTATFSFQAPRFAEVGPKKELFIRPFGYRVGGYVEEFTALGTRLLPLKISVPHTRERDVKIHLPDGFSIPSLPEDFTLETSRVAFSFQISEEDEGRTLRLKTSFSIKVHRVEPEDYAAFRDELRQVDHVLNGILTLSPPSP